MEWIRPGRDHRRPRDPVRRSHRGPAGARELRLAPRSRRIGVVERRSRSPWRQDSSPSGATVTARDSTTALARRIRARPHAGRHGASPRGPSTPHLLRLDGTAVTWGASEPGAKFGFELRQSAAPRHPGVERSHLHMGPDCLSLGAWSGPAKRTTNPQTRTVADSDPARREDRFRPARDEAVSNGNAPVGVPARRSIQRRRGRTQRRRTRPGTAPGTIPLRSGPRRP